MLNLWCPAAEQGADVVWLVPGACQGLPERAPGCAAQIRDSTFCANVFAVGKQLLSCCFSGCQCLNHDIY